MGFFDKIKKAASFITGNTARVELNIANGNLGSPFIASIKVKVGEANLDVKNVYLCIQCTETTKQEITTEEGTETEENNTTLFETKMVVAEGSVFESGKEYEFSKEITLPGDAVPSTNEGTRAVVWEFMAGLDTKGNDPDSGWLHVNMSRVS